MPGYPDKCDFAVLGMDIFQYSQLKDEHLHGAPEMMHTALRHTMELVWAQETIFFNNAKPDYKKFIDSGDGGFLLFDNPLQAIIFLVHFATKIENLPKRDPMSLRLTFRYTLTYGKLYVIRQDHSNPSSPSESSHRSTNYYGDALIRNSRIMASDKLNRCLVDQPTLEWCEKIFGGIENLKNCAQVDFLGTEIMQDTPKANQSLNFSEWSMHSIFPIFHDANQNSTVFESLEVAKIGPVQIKQDRHEVYSIHMMLRWFEYREQNVLTRQFTMSIGNQNAAGLGVS